jgi:HlyD family secretion protein
VPRSLSRRAALAALAASVLAAGCSDPKESAPSIALAAVERRDIQVDVEATGVVEPINVIEVKSKASGQITQMPVESGDLVQPGALLVQLDTRDVRNQYDQAEADVRAAEASVSVARSQKVRSDTLFAQRIVTAQEHEQSALTFANAQAQVVRARTNLDLARQRLEDATVRAPVAGTIIEKLVSLGQVISSATGSVSGGTTLLKMADLNSVRVRALVNETDIGNVRPGQTARVIVDAYPDRPFIGVVEKIEPQAVVQQSVTMFPVLVTIQNREGLLKPGMNGEVSVLIERRDDVLAVPNDAVRSPREVAAAASVLGLDPAAVQEQVRAQVAAAGGAGGRRTFSSPGAVAAAPGEPNGEANGQAPRRRRRVPAGQAPDSASARLQPPPEGAGPGSGGRIGLVFVPDSAGFSPRVVRLGVSNYDYSEVLSGLAEGDSVALLAAAAMQAQRAERNEQLRSRMGGVPGMTRQTPAAGGSRGGGR